MTDCKKQNTLSCQYWKTLSFHFLDIAQVNSYILFQDWRKRHSDAPKLVRPQKYLQFDFTIELIRQPGDISETDDIPVYDLSAELRVPDHPINPQHHRNRKNCKRCYRLYKEENKTKVFCGTCKKHLCFNADRNCLKLEHQQVNSD